MQIKGKIFTIAGIVLLFGYFIKDSFKDPYDPTQVVMIGNDTLGRDWGAMAEQVANAGKNLNSEGEVSSVNSNSDVASVNSEKTAKEKDAELLKTQQDPFNKQKLNKDNYSSIQSPDGREIITGYNRPEDPANNDDDDADPNNIKFKSRHQIEAGEEPEMKYRD